MRFALGLVHVLTGWAYLLGIGLMTAIDIVRIRRATGKVSMFGVALMAIGITCGPHHLEHGLHILDHTLPVGAANLVATLVALPFGAVFLGLRVEGLLGGRGDRTFHAPYRLMRLAPFAMSLYAGAVLAVPLVRRIEEPDGSIPLAAPQAILVGLYSLVGYLLWSTQLRRAKDTDTWSLSGLTLAAIFPTCAVTHAHYAIELGRGEFSPDIHLALIDTGGAIAAAALLVVVALERIQQEET